MIIPGGILRGIQPGRRHPGDIEDPPELGNSVTGDLHVIRIPEVSIKCNSILDNTSWILAHWLANWDTESEARLT